MATRPIIDIQVNSAEFEKFNALFTDFTKKLDEQPEAWSKLNNALGGASDATGALSEGALTAKEAIALAGAQAAIVAEALTNAVKAQNSLEDASHSTNKKMSELAKTAKNLGSEIAGVGKWVLRLGSGALAGLGLGALAGGFGLTELANKAYARSRSAEGLGLSPGQLASFSVNAQPFLDEGALHSAAAAQTTYQSAPYLQMLGIDFTRAQTMNAADLAFEELKGAVRNWQDAQKAGTPPAASPFVQAYEELGGSLEDVRRAVRLGLPAVNAAQAGYRRDVGVLGFDRQTAAAWTNFHKQLDRAGFEIETVFINKLGPLVPEFRQLSKDLINAVAGFVNSKDFGALMGRLQDGLQSFVKWVEGPDPKKLWAGLSLVGSEVMAVADKLKWILPSTQAAVLPPEPGHKEAGFGKLGALEYDASKGAYVDKSTGNTYYPGGFDSVAGWVDKNGNVYDSASKTWKPTPLSQITGALGSAWNSFSGLGAALGSAMNRGASSSSHSPLNNPLDVTTGSDSNGLLFAHYKSVADGIRAGAALLEKYPTSWDAKTLGAALPIWSGLTGDPKAAANYIGNVEKWSGVSRNESIADFTRAQLAAVVAAMSRMEGTAVVTADQAAEALYGAQHHAAMKKHTDRIIKSLRKVGGPVQISISNSTSARVAVSANALAVG